MSVKIIVPKSAALSPLRKTPSIIIDKHKLTSGISFLFLRFKR